MLGSIANYIILQAHSALVAKVLWLPPITAHCFRPQWATPDQPVLWRANAVQCPMCTVQYEIWYIMWKVQCFLSQNFWRANAVHVHRKCSGRSCGKCRRAVNAMYCGVLAYTAHWLHWVTIGEALTDRWPALSLILSRLHASQQPFH